MRSSFFALSLASGLPSAWAGRGNSTSVVPTECPLIPNNPSNDTASGSVLGRGDASMRLKAFPVSGSTAERRRTTRLDKRGGTVTYDQSCDRAPPSGSGYGPDNGFPKMTDVLKAAYNDAVELAGAAQNVDVNNKGFSHYFGEKDTTSTEGKDRLKAQHDHFKGMMEGVASSTNNYDIKFVCEDPENECAKKASLMATDPSTLAEGDKVKGITVCDLFWTGGTTQYLLKSQAEPSPPYRDDTKNGWCEKRYINDQPSDVSRQNVQFFATAGHTVLHELTHLDALAAKAGLSPNPAEKNRHGTEDVQTQCELIGARDFLKKYKQKKTGGTSPDYNAESYAAAATEIFFMNRCDFSEIWPTVS